MVAVSDRKKRKLGTAASINDVSPKKKASILSKNQLTNNDSKDSHKKERSVGFSKSDLNKRNEPLKWDKKLNEQAQTVNGETNEFEQNKNLVEKNVDDEDNVEIGVDAEEPEEEEEDDEVEDEEEVEEEEDDDDDEREEENNDDDDDDDDDDVEEVEEDDYIDEIEMIQEPKDVRRKVPIKYIENRTRRQVTFAKRRHGIMKKAYELSVLTGANILLLILGHSGLVYTFSTPKLEPIIRENKGKQLIRNCLNSQSSSTTATTVAVTADPQISN
ncbi:hypothetical protein RI543_000421 [Arxiozyma heterogenica]|uniref:MADS-box domain-containing protein n=1 Tax=Arxiozyma heterogenica TaxID=278026 RepID=A0AAN7ZTC6_9SACH|nr:hypothetical protein RI543_000421 [Kazachstania heterogenica]